jgi:hypothetical protein
MNKYPLTHNNKSKEKAIINEILVNNNYPQQAMYQKQKPPKPRVEQKRKWATFTYFGPETRTINKLFKNTDVGILFRTKNNIKHHFRIKRSTTEKEKYNLSGVHKLQCTECPRKYIEQTGRTFKTRYKEHIRDIKKSGQYSKFAQHITETEHEYGMIEKTMKILHIEKKSQILKTYERFHICEAISKTCN